MSISDIKTALDASKQGQFGFPYSEGGTSGTPILLKTSDAKQYKAMTSYDRLIPISQIPASPAVSSQVNVNYQLTGMQSHVVRQIKLQFVVSNPGGAATLPVTADFWINRIDIYAGSNIIETIYPEEIHVMSLLENDNTDILDIEYLSNSNTANTGFQPSATGIAAGVTNQYVYCILPEHSITSSFLFLPGVKNIIQYQVYLAGGNQFYTTAAQTLTFQQINMQVTGIQYDPEAYRAILDMHMTNTVVSQYDCFYRTVYTIGQLGANTQYSTLLAGFQGDAVMLAFFLRPTIQGGTTNYGLDLFFNNLTMGTIQQLTDIRGIPVINNMDSQLANAANDFDFAGSIRLYNGNKAYVIPFSLSNELSNRVGADVGALEMNGLGNYLIWNSTTATNYSVDLWLFAKIKSFFTIRQGILTSTLL